MRKLRIRGWGGLAACLVFALPAESFAEAAAEGAAGSAGAAAEQSRAAPKGGPQSEGAGPLSQEKGKAAQNFSLESALEGAAGAESPEITVDISSGKINLIPGLSRGAGERTPAAKKTRRTRIQRGKKQRIPVRAGRKRRRRGINLREIQPPSSYQKYYVSGTDEAELEEIQNQEIAHLFRLLKKRRDPELILRLGSIYKEKAQFISHKLHADFDKKMEEHSRGARKPRPRLNLRAAEVYNRKALKLFRGFKRDYPRHRRMDEVLHHLGFHAYQLGIEGQGSVYFAELERRFPKSPHLYDARFQLGEHFFSQKKWKESFGYYSKTAARKGGRFYFFSLYKMAWASYKMGQAKRGLALLERIIREGRRAEGGAASKFAFASDAADDLVLFYTYSGRPLSKAKDYFLDILGARAWPQIKKLAYVCLDTGKTRGAIALLKSLIRHDSAAPEASDYQYHIVDAVYVSGPPAAILREAAVWARAYGRGSAWARANRRDPYLIQKTSDRIEVTLRKYALENHQSFRRSRSQRAKTLALSFYKIYFSGFKDSKWSDQVRFFHGELLFDLGEFQAAARAYDHVIVRHQRSKYAAPAYTNQLLALEKALPSQKKLKAITAAAEKGPVRFPPAVKHFAAASLRYLKRFPNEKNSSAILYRVAAFYYNFGHLSAAAGHFQAFSEKYPRSPLISNVGGILLDIYNKNKNYEALEKLAAQFARSRHADKSLVKEARMILEQLSFKKAQDLALAKKYGDSARHYEKFARDIPGAALTAVAWYNAGLNYEKAKDIKKAAAMYAEVLRHDPKKYASIQKKAREFIPALQEKLGFYKKAAEGYAFYAEQYPGSPKAADYWYNAGVIFDALNHAPRAVHAYTQYRALKRGGEKHKALYLIGLLYERRRQWQRAIDHYGFYLKSNTPDRLSLVQASFRTAEIYSRLGNRAKADFWRRRTMTLHGKLRAGVSYAARSHFVFASRHYGAFQQARIPRNPRLQAAAIAKKIKLLRQLEERLKPVIRYNDGEQIIAALSLTGKANREMAQALFNVPLPKGLGKEGLRQYKEGVKKLVSPYVRDALRNYRLAIEKARKLRIYSEGLGEAHAGLAAIKITEGKFEGFAAEPALKEILPLEALDKKGVVSRSILSRLEPGSGNSGISGAEFRTIASAVKSQQEKKMLDAVSGILNKDPDNLTAIKSLAVFYFDSKRPQLGALILNRLLSKRRGEPSLLNNLGVAAWRRGEVREAVSLFKKALMRRSSYYPARINLATIFASSHDYYNSYLLYRSSYKKFLAAGGAGKREKTALLNNYGAALAGAKKWRLSVNLFKKLSSEPSPKPEILLNYGIALTEAPEDNFDRGDYVKARGLVDELKLYSNSPRLKRKLAKLSRRVSFGLKQAPRKPAAGRDRN